MPNAILLAEDNPSDEKLMLKALSMCGYDSRTNVVRDGAEVIDYLSGSGKYSSRQAESYVLPRVILLDLKMPRLDGFEVLRQIRSNPLTKHVPVVILSTSTESEDILKCFNLGANAYLSKPVSFTDLVPLAETFTKFWVEYNQRAIQSGVKSE